MIRKRQRYQPSPRQPASDAAKNNAISNFLISPRARVGDRFVPVRAAQGLEPSRRMKNGRSRMPLEEFGPSWVADGIDLVELHRISPLNDFNRANCRGVPFRHNSLRWRSVLGVSIGDHFSIIDSDYFASTFRSADNRVSRSLVSFESTTTSRNLDEKSLRRIAMLDITQ